MITELDWKIERWHNGEGEGLELHEFLGLTFREYSELMSKQKTITFYDKSGMTDHACDCCPSYYVDEWVSEDGTIIGHSREDCYISALEYFGYPIRSMNQGDCSSFTEDELESIAREFGVVVDFVS